MIEHRVPPMPESNVIAHCDGRYLYIFHQITGIIQKIDLETGAITEIITFLFNRISPGEQ